LGSGELDKIAGDSDKSNEFGAEKWEGGYSRGIGEGAAEYLGDMMWYLDGFQAGMGCFVNLGEATLGLLVNEDQRMERLAALLESSELKSAVESYNDRGRLTEQVLAVPGTIFQISELNGLVKYCGEWVRCRMNWTLEFVEDPEGS